VTGWLRAIAYVMWKELLELRQDPRLFPVLFIAPIIQLIVLGYAATTDVLDIPLLVVDPDRSAASRELTSRFDRSRYFTIVDAVGSVEEVEPYLASGRAWMALAIPPGFGEDVASGTPVTVQIVADGTDSNSAGIGLGYAGGLLAEHARAIVEERGMSPPGGIDARIRVWFNPELESRDFMVPGVLALILLVITMVLASMAIVRERELGTLEQLNVTPVTRSQLILGKLLPYAAIGIVDIVLVVAVAVLWFEVPLRGSLLLLFALSLLYILNTLGLGLLVSTISSTQQQAMMTATFLFLVPMIYLSGFIFPIENMPAAIQQFTYVIPLRYYLVIVRGLFLKGVGLEVLWPQAAALGVLGVAILGLAVLRSSKRTA